MSDGDRRVYVLYYERTMKERADWDARVLAFTRMYGSGIRPHRISGLIFKVRSGYKPYGIFKNGTPLIPAIVPMGMSTTALPVSIP